MSGEGQEYTGKCALVVDDDRAVRLILRRMLEKLGFEVDEAHDGDVALKSTRKQTYDLVFTDLSMPGKNGLEFLNEAREAGFNAPVIFLTATGSVSTAVEAIKAGAFEFMEKPLKVKQLGDVVKSAMTAKVADPSTLALDIDVEETVEEMSVSFDSDPTKGVVGVDGKASKPPPTPRVGETKTIGRYEIVRRIGRGGMGVVYQCRDPRLNRMVAVKVLHVLTDRPEHAAEASARFRREAAAAGALQHPAIVDIYDLGHDENLGDWFIVMELLEGRGLSEELDAKGALGAEQVVRLGFDVSDALATAHAKKVVHRDIKPSNVLVGSDGSVKLLDFGLAAVEGWDVTMGGRIFGSPSYMAPERIAGDAGGTAADQFSLGVVLYETLTNANPFDGETPEARLKNVLMHHPPPPGIDDTSIPDELSETIAHMLNKDPKGRYPSMDHVTSRFIDIGKGLGLDLKKYRSGESA